MATLIKALTVLKIDKYVIQWKEKQGRAAIFSPKKMAYVYTVVLISINALHILFVNVSSDG